MAKPDQLVQRDSGGYTYAFRRQACLAQFVGQRHREAAGMSCRNQLFRVGAFSVLSEETLNVGSHARHNLLASVLMAAAMAMAGSAGRSSGGRLLA
jgi:hypothetical protein